MRWNPQRTVLVDTNLLVLLIIGSVAPSHISRVGRTRGYSEDDYHVARSIVNRFACAATTPHVLTETSNLVLQGVWGGLAEEVVKRLRGIYITADERFVPAHKLFRDRFAASFGLADSAIIDAARRGCTVLSDDLALSLAVESLGLAAINFNHLRFRSLGTEEIE